MVKVITYGTFDLLHQGHVNLLRRAKALGDYLIVGVTSENYDRYRGKLNVQQSVSERIENVRRTGLADEILIEEYEGQKIDDIVRLNAGIFVLGSDWVGRFDYLKEYCQVVYLERTKGISSTQMRDQQHPMIHFGVVGNGRIASRFVKEIKFVSGTDVERVFNIHEASAREFCQRYELAGYDTSFDRFLEHINAVYIASPHETHVAYARRALLAGKHVLCEKPMALSASQAQELFALAQERGLILMEAIKTAYCPGFQRLISCARSGKIGKIVSVDAAFTKLVSPHMREVRDDGVGGSMTELATYPLLAVFRLLGYDYRDIRFTSYYGEKKGVDLFTRIDFLYPDAMATAKIGLGVKSEGDLVISGTRGYIYVPAPWWKTDYFELRFENPAETEKNFYKFLGDGLRYEIVEFLNRVRDGHMDHSMCKLSCSIADILEQYRAGKYVIRLNELWCADVSDHQKPLAGGIP